MTEVALPATGTWVNPGKGGAEAAILITALEDEVPLLFVEIDNCFESAQVLPAKIDKYMRFGQRKVKDVDGKERPMWRTRWCARRPPRRSAAPADAARLQPDRPAQPQHRLAQLAERHWRGTAHDGGFHMYDGKLPIVVTSISS
ncbi:hypothetical protein [Streptomyces sp. CoH17]|uniref:hypothetical protein n=1 Tax=Streptomyces sp. CoH17 TaxID=2992806 RepID=UPI00226D8069|nr:hypothetical protein [Streptomyces sp. CoH17]